MKTIITCAQIAVINDRKDIILYRRWSDVQGDIRTWLLANHRQTLVDCGWIPVQTTGETT